MWAMRKEEVIPDVVGAIPKGLNKSLQDLGIRVRPGHVQKAALPITRNCKNTRKSP